MDTPKLHIDNRLHFGIPVFETHLPGFEDHQQKLSETLLRLRDQDYEAMQRSNMGGWHSVDTLHHSTDTEILWLTQQIMNIGTKCIHHLEDKPFNGKVSLANMWVNINGSGDWNMPHCHLPYEYSGVVYIRAHNPESNRNSRDGNLILLNPMPVGRQYKRAPSISYEPKSGGFFLFPGYLMHMVAPHFDQEDRISVAFNFKVSHQES